MTIWAIGDLHLAFSIPNKSMEFFGDPWVGYTEKIKHHWVNLISNDDLVLIPGDISWAMRPEEARKDLEWIDQLPGTKVMIRGNHDYWWSSLSRAERILPPSIHLIQNNAFHWNEYGIGGTRLWDTPEYCFSNLIEYRQNPRARNLDASAKNPNEDLKIFQRELTRLETSCKSIDSKRAKFRIVMTHYPPIGSAMEPSQTSEILKKYQINCCVFGHLHNIRNRVSLFGESEGIRYYLTSCDYLDFTPIKIA